MNELEAHRAWQLDYFSWNPIGDVPKAAVLKIRDLGVNWHAAHWKNSMISGWLKGEIEIEPQLQEFEEFRSSLGSMKT